MASDLEILEAPAGEAAGGEEAAGTGGDTAAVETATAAAEPAAAGEPEGRGASPAAQDEAEPAIELEYPEGDEAEPAAAAERAEPADADSAPGSARYGTAALTRLLKDNAELATAAEASPRVKAQLYQMARRSQELAAYQDLVPSLAQAKEAAAARDTLEGYDQAYFGREPEAFWSGLHQASGQTGAYERNVQFMHKLFLDGLGEEAGRSGNEGLRDAVAAIRETLGWGNSRTTPNSRAKGRAGYDDASAADDARQRGSNTEQDLPPQIRQQLEQGERNTRELEQLRSRRSQEERQATEQFLNDTAGEVGREIRSFVDGILAQAKLSDYDKANIARDFLEQVQRLGDEDKVHNAALEEILQQGGQTPATRAQMVARVKAWTRQNGREILEPILRQAGAGLRQRQQQREQVQAKARQEPRTTGAPAQPATLSARDLVRQAEATAKRRLSDREILDLA